jgi:hypothetical protein
VQDFKKWWPGISGLCRGDGVGSWELGGYHVNVLVARVCSHAQPAVVDVPKFATERPKGCNAMTRPLEVVIRGIHSDERSWSRSARSMKKAGLSSKAGHDRKHQRTQLTFEHLNKNGDG